MTCTNRNMLATLSRLHGLRFIEGEDGAQQDAGDDDAEAQDLLADAVNASADDAAGAQNSRSLDDADLEGLRSEIRKLRRENQSVRKSRDDAKNDLAQQIGKALGLVEDESLDPAKLTEQLTAQTSAAKRAQLKLAVYQAATAAGGDPSALLDSQSFLSQVEQVDPSDQEAVKSAIAEAISTNPRLAAQSQSRLPAPSQAHGASATGPVEPAQWSQADVDRAYAARDYDGIEKARKEGHLKQVMGE